MKTTWPFSEILRPVAEEALAGATASPLIRQEFARQLERRLSGVLSQCLFLLFTAQRMSAEVFHGTRAGCYAEFVEDIVSLGLPGALQDYPVAVDAVAILSKQARTFAEEFASHLLEDARSIAALPRSSRSMKVRNVSAGWSDPHRGGRTVVKVTFEDGGGVFYKPRSLAVDAVWRDGLQRINSQLPMRLHSAIVLDRGDHGWAKAIPTINDLSRSEAGAFYWRYGALLCLAWLLDATDLHRDNVILSGAHPVLVDAECLLHPLDRHEARTLARTCIISPPHEGLDFSALGPVKAQEGIQRIVWEGVGTDEMRMYLRRAIEPAASHLPLVNGSLFSPAEAADYIAEGFEATVGVAGRASSAIEEWRAELNNVPRRRIYRPTIHYAEILRAAAHPGSVGSAGAWEEAVRGLQRGREDVGLLISEREQLAQWDVPVFASGSIGALAAPWHELAERRHEWELQVRAWSQAAAAS